MGNQDLKAELERLRARLEEAEETLAAIRNGEVDALVVGGPQGEQIYTLRGADHSYRLLLEEMDQGAATLMLDGTILYCNKRLAQMVQAPLESMIGAQAADLAAPSDRELFEALLRRGSRDLAKAEVAFAAADGRTTPAYCSLSPIDIEGVACVFLVATDLTEQKRSEEIMASEKLARHILERAVDVIVVCDENGMITRASRAARDLAGANVLQQPFGAAFPLSFKNGAGVSSATDGPEADGSFITHCLGGKTVQGMEVELRRADGQRFALLMSAGPIRDIRGRSRGCVFTLTDVTRLKRAEEELRRSEAQLSAELTDTKLLQRISAELIQEENDRVLYEKILDAAVETMGSDMASMQMVDESEDALRLFAWRGFGPEFGRIYGLNRRDAKTSCSAARQLGRRVIVPDVETCDFIAGTPALEGLRETGIRAVQSTPLISRTGRVVGMISTHWRRPHEPSERDLRLLDILARQAADLIERKRAEESLRESEEKLRVQARELEEQLIATGRLVSLGEITASMAHEFNNPLGIVLGFAEDLLSEKDASSPDYQSLRIIHEETKRCQKIIEELLDYSRPRPTERRRTDVRRLVEKSLHLVTTHLYKRKIGVAVEIEPGLPPIHADDQQLEQVLVNLFFNAIDAMPNGGALTVAADCGACSAGRVTISVTDTGAGISAAELPQIFKPFFSRGKKSGLGLGLPICERIVANHGGRMEVESRPARGTTFRIYLPLERPAAAEPAAFRNGGAEE